MPAAKRPAPHKSAVVPSQKNLPETVDAGWLLKALGICLAAALVCAWLTACLLVYQGEWQLVLHPARTVDRTPASVGLAYTEVAFGAEETGQPRLTGWWIPAEAQSGLEARHAAFTFLFLHDGSGSLSDTVPALARMHRAGLNVFAFDYRGFGKSDASEHPTSKRMTYDTETALDYLTGTRHIAESDIVPYGSGLGGSLAAELAVAHPQIPALVLDNPDPDPTATAVAAHPSKIIPVRLLFGDQFNVRRPLSHLMTAKLLVAGGPGCIGGCDPGAMETLFRQAPSPRFVVTLPRGSGDAELQTALGQFIDQSLASR